MTENWPAIGSYSEGTMRPEDIIPVLCDIVAEHGDYAQKAIATAWKTNDPGDGDPLDAMSELWEICESLAPPYCDFGCHEGDGASIGFWPYVDSVQDAVDEGDMLRVQDWSELPNDYEGEVCHVSDHGNLTVGYADGHGVFLKYWSIV